MILKSRRSGRAVTRLMKLASKPCLLGCDDAGEGSLSEVAQKGFGSRTIDAHQLNSRQFLAGGEKKSIEFIEAVAKLVSGHSRCHTEICASRFGQRRFQLGKELLLRLQPKLRRGLHPDRTQQHDQRTVDDSTRILDLQPTEQIVIILRSSPDLI